MVTPDYEGEENANQMSTQMIHRDEHHRLASAKKTILTNKWGSEAFAQMPPLSYINLFLGTQTNTNMITPTTGKKLVVYGVQIDSSVTNVCCASVNFVSSTGQLVWKVFFDKAKGVQSWMPIYITGGTDESLVLNTLGFAADDELFLSVAYDEMD